MTSKRYEAVNSNIFGLNQDERERGDYQLHPLIRSDWKSADRLRDAQGDVPTLRVNPANGNLEVNEDGQLNGATSYPFEKPNSYGLSAPGGAKDTRTHSITLLFDPEAWNNGTIVVSDQVSNLLDEDNSGTDIAGVPYFEKYFSVNPQNLPTGNDPRYGLLTTDARMEGATRDTPPLMDEIPSTPDQAILSHKFSYDYHGTQSPNASYNIEVEPTYNLFLDTSPDYETVIANVPETLIPNFYHIEVSIALSDSTDPVPQSYIPFSLNGPGEFTTAEYLDVLAGSLSGSDISENQNNSQGYLQFYSSNASSLDDDYTVNYGNVAVLGRDISFNVLSNINNTARDNRGTSDETDDLFAIDTYPFYNKITIPYDNQWGITSAPTIVGTQPPSSVIETLKNDPAVGLDFTQWLMITLELLLLRELRLESSEQPFAVPFTIYDTTENNLVVANNLSIPLPIKIDAVLNDFLQGLTTNGTPESGGPFEFINNLIQSPKFLDSGDAPSLGASLITNRIYEVYHDLTINEVNATKIENALNTIATFRRNFFSIHRNLPGEMHNSEAIMYVVEKRVIPPGQVAAADTDPVVQRFFFGRDIVFNSKGAVYYDTQIKYGVRYQYDIKQIRMIVGESYYYDSVVTIANSGAVGQSRALGNALGFYAEEAAPFQATTTFTIANNLSNFEYAPEDESPEGSDYGFTGDTGLFGYYVYKTYNSLDPGAAGNIDQIFGVRTDTEYVVDPAFQNSRQPAETDLSLLPIRIKYGSGFDGNFTGGATTAVAENIYGSPAVPVEPEVDCPPPPGGGGPGEDPIGDAIDEGVEESNETIQGLGVQLAEAAATEQQESEIVSELATGQIQVAGGLTLDNSTGVDFGQFVFDTGNPLSEFGPGGFGGDAAFDALDIAQNAVNGAGNNVGNTGFGTGFGEAGFGELGMNNLNSGVNNAGNNAAGNLNNLNFDLLNGLFNNGFVGP